MPCYFVPAGIQFNDYLFTDGHAKTIQGTYRTSVDVARTLVSAAPTLLSAPNFPTACVTAYLSNPTAVGGCWNCSEPVFVARALISTLFARSMGLCPERRDESLDS